MMRLTVEIAGLSPSSAAGQREWQASFNEFAAALKLVADKLSNSGAPEGKHAFEYGDLHGSFMIAHSASSAR